MWKIPNLQKRDRLGIFLGRKQMNKWISIISEYLNKFLELGVLLLAVSVIAEILFGPNVAFFGTKVTSNLIDLLNNLGDQGIAALIVVFAILFVYRKYLK
tara:strand:- start:97 stop:396 length:300 start_codon:yes stop_codon:yes gene_type:complete